ncbi:MAG: OmpH family outer membrane protein [Acidobacteria bacterium]|nr:OmpH family outer membrane protein [Acidobacteriota bacterium]
MYRSLMALVLIFVSAALVRAQETTTFPKIGFVNTLEVLYGTEEGKKEIGTVEQFMSEKQKEFESKGTELEKLREQFINQQRTLNPETRNEMQRNIEERDKEIKRFQEDTQLEINRRRDALLEKMSEKIQRIITEFAEKNKFSIIFLRDQSQPYVAASLDVTQEIIKIYNERYPLAAPAASQQQVPAQPKAGEPAKK